MSDDDDLIPSDTPPSEEELTALSDGLDSLDRAILELRAVGKSDVQIREILDLRLRNL